MSRHIIVKALTSHNTRRDILYMFVTCHRNILVNDSIFNVTRFYNLSH